MIDILLATYNGERYIKQQLYSLLGQTFQDWKLLIHDDGSTDDTVKIIKEFLNIDKRLHFIEDNIFFGNAGENFMHLLKFSCSEYIIFCDQDDVWFENKLAVLYNLIKKEKGACAAYCNSYLYDGKEIIGDKVTRFHRDSLQNSLFLNGGVQGCSLMFNQQLKSILGEFPSYIYMHDHFITIATVTFGKMLHTNSSLMLYRQHNNNVTGNMHINFSDKLKTFFKLNNPVIEKRHFKANMAFYEYYKNKIEDKDLKLFEAYFQYPDANIINRIRIIISNSFRIGKNNISLLLKTIIRKPML